MRNYSVWMDKGSTLYPEDFWPFPWDEKQAKERINFARLGNDPDVLARLKARHEALNLN